MTRCPGSTSFSQPKPDGVTCPDCGAEVEIWTDETKGVCPKCSRVVTRTLTQSCLDWCAYARDCLGDEMFENYRAMKAALPKSRC